MAGDTKAIRVAVVVASIISSLTLPAYAQSFKKGVGSAAPTDTRPKVDEKAYNAALDRIPTPKQGYDPWGVARPTEPAKTGK